MAELFTLPARATDSNGDNLSGAKIYFYATGTTTPQNVYSDVDLNTSLGAVVTADSGGKFVGIYLDPTKTYRAVLKTSDDVTTIYDLDPIGSGGNAGDIQFTQDGTGAVIRTVQAKLREDAISIIDFGGVGDDVTNNDTAFSDAIAAVRAKGGGYLYVPTGVYRCTSISVPDGVAVHIFGDGEQSVIRTTSATADLLTLTAWYSTVSRVKFLTSTTRTAGAYVTLAGAYTRAYNCHFDSDYIGVKMTGVGCKVIRNVFSNGANSARRIWASGGDTSQTIENNLMAAQAAGVSAGIFVDNSAALKIVDNDIIGQGRCLHIAPGNGQSVFSLWSRGNFYDTAAYGIAIEPSGTGTVYRCAIEDDWASSHTSDGILLSASGSAVINGIDIHGTETNLNGGNGVVLNGAGVTNVRYRGGPISRNNTGSAFVAQNSAGYFIVDGLQAQAADGLLANNYGVFLGTTDNYQIINCNLTGQTTGNLSGWTTGSTTKIARNNAGFVTNARGTATITSGSGSVTVTHGLAGTPTRIVTTPRNDPVGRWWCEDSNRTSTQFTINQNNAAVGYNVLYDWEAFYE